MNKKYPSHTKGITLTEALIGIAVLGSLAMMATIGARFIGSAYKNKATSENRVQAQHVLYNLAKDVRNSNFIVSISSTALVLQVFNTQGGFDTAINPNLFDPINIGTVTYQYVEDLQDTYLRKTIFHGGVFTEEKKLLKNMLVPPSDENYIFNPCAAYDTPPCNPALAAQPFSSVEITFRLKPFDKKSAVVVNTALAMRRASANQI